MPKASTSTSTRTSFDSPVFSPDGSSGSQAPRKVRKGFSRSRHGCLTCRKNHQKCDEGRPGCMRCQLGRRDCIWADGYGESEDVKPTRSLVSEASTAVIEYNQSTSLHDPSYLDSLVGSASLTIRQPLEPCALAYPDPGQKRLIQLFVREAGKLIVNIDVQPQQVTFLDLPRILSTPGSGFSADALRFSLLGIGALHEAWVNRNTDPNVLSGTLKLAGSMKDAATACLSATVALSNLSPLSMAVSTTGQGQGQVQGQEDQALMAAAMLSFASVLSGLKNQHQPFGLAYSMLRGRGGPAKVLDAVRDPGARSGVQKVLEFISVIDCLDALGTGRVPDFLCASEDNLYWWSKAGETRSYLELDTVETTFGVSRVVLAVFAKVVALVSRASSGNRRITNLSSNGDEAWDIDLLVECAALEEQLVTCTASELYTLSLPRAQQGDQVYLQTAKLLLARSIRRVPRMSQEIQMGAMSILTLLLDCHNRFGSVLYFMWPLLISGSEITEHFRPLVRTLIEVFSGTYLFDCAAASAVLQIIWTRLDNGGDDQIQNVVREHGYHFM